ncbi:MAG: InlB B-repeat-containing protein [Erysipelotrichales bacterium]|nr:InlB B-repeat-containing protein [Erysipelotrichales bacterium]
MKKKNIIVLIVLLTIGFAAVTTTLLINGTTKIGANTEDFNIFFSKALLDKEDVSDKVITNNGEKISFETRTLKTLGEETILDFEVTNASKNYDAIVTMTCDINEDDNEFIYVNNTMIDTEIKARTIGQGKITITLRKSVVEDLQVELNCELKVEAGEREALGTNEINEIRPNTFSLYGYFVDAEENPVRNARLVMYSEEPKYIKTDSRGYFYISGLEKGEHELYYIQNKTLEELKDLSKEEVKTTSTASTTISAKDTEEKEIDVGEEYKIIDSIIEKTVNRTYTITLDPNGGELENREYQVSQNKEYGVLPTPTREGHIFLGWFLENQKIEGDYLVTEHETHTLTAQWTHNLDFPFNNTFNDIKVYRAYNGGTASATLTQTFTDTLEGNKIYAYYVISQYTATINFTGNNFSVFSTALGPADYRTYFIKTSATTSITCTIKANGGNTVSYGTAIYSFE